MRYLAIDLGDKRTGLAVGDDETMIVSPLDTIVTAGAEERLRQIGRHLREQMPDAIVLGIPFNMDGSAGKPAARARAIGQQLATRFELQVIEMDERQTSIAADEQMARTGLTHGQKKARRDALAAAAILRNYLEAN